MSDSESNDNLLVSLSLQNFPSLANFLLTWKSKATMSNDHLQRINLTAKDKQLLEKLSGQNIYLKNSFGINQAEIEKLMEQGKMNALLYLERHRQGQTLSIFEEQNLFNSLVEIQKKLGLKIIPEHIECYDISHFAGKQVYGSMITFIDGRPVKQLYRLFKTVQRNNDYANLQEVLARRLNRWVQNLETETTLRVHFSTGTKPIKPWALPHLIIIDGGKGQLSSALSVLDDFKSRYPQIQTEICSLAKQEEEVFLPHLPESVKFEGQPKFLLQRIRDEAHRFGITNQRKATIKHSVQSSLDQIEGIGPTTRQKLLSLFGSVENIVENYYSNPEMVEEVLNKKQFQAIKKWVENGAVH